MFHFSILPSPFYLPFVWTRRPQGCCWCREWRWLELVLALADHTSLCLCPGIHLRYFFIFKSPAEHLKLEGLSKFISSCWSWETEKKSTKHQHGSIQTERSLHFLSFRQMHLSKSYQCISTQMHFVSILNMSSLMIWQWYEVLHNYKTTFILQKS